MLPEQITGMRLPSEGGQPQSILITSSNGTTPAKVQHTIVVRENPNIKQEYFVQDTNTDITITTNNSNMLNNNSVSTICEKAIFGESIQSTIHQKMAFAVPLKCYLGPYP